MISSHINEEAKECPSSDGRNERLSSSASASVERDAESFLQKLNVIVVDPDSSEETTLDPKQYRNQFESLLTQLKLAHSREASLADQSQVLQNQNLEHAAELEAMNLSNKDLESQVSTLQADLDTVKSLLESQNAREDRAREQAGVLQNELERLTDLVDKNEIASARKDSEAKQLASEVEEWKNQATAANDKISSLSADVQRGKSQLEQLQSLYKETTEDKASLKDHLSERNEEIKREAERSAQARRETEQARRDLEGKTKEFIDMQYAAALAQSKVASLEKQVVEAKKATTLKEQELKEETIKTQKLASIKSEQKKVLAEQKDTMAEAEIKLKKSQLEQQRLMSENAQLERTLEAERKTVLQLKQLVEDAKAAARLSSDEAHLLKKEVDMCRKKEDEFNRTLLMLKRENGLQLGRIQMSEERAKKSGTELQHTEQLIASLEKDLASAKDETNKQELFSRRLEGECDGLRHQLKDSQVTCQRLMDEIKVLNQSRTSMHKKMGELQGQMELQSKQQDSIRIDMNNSLKDLADAQREINILQQAKNNDQRLIDTLRSEISMKDSALVKENFEYRKEMSHRELLADEISRMKRSLAENEEEIRTYQSDARRFSSTIRKLESDAQAQARENEHVINERDILGTQLIRRNDEVALLYEKIKILQSTQRRGELQYNSRLDDIRILKIKVRDLQRQVSIAKTGQAGADDLSRALALVQRELIRERLKVKTLSDELENPVNVHRWRKLEGSDPQAYEMVQKIHSLQKRLLLKSEEVVEKNTIIQEQEKRHTEMEKILARKPGPEAAEQLLSYQNDVRKKSKQMKAMASELNMHQTQVNEYKRQIDELNTELHNTKRKFFEQKKRETMAKEKEIDLLSGLAPSTLIKPFKDQSTSAKTRFMGGGFAIK